MIFIRTICCKTGSSSWTWAIIHSIWLWENDCVRLVRLWVSPGFRVRVIIQAITHKEERGSRHGGWGVLLLRLKANGLCVWGSWRERERGGQSADSEVMGCLSSPLSHSRTCQSCRLTAHTGSPPTCLSTLTISLKVPADPSFSLSFSLSLWHSSTFSL